MARKKYIVKVYKMQILDLYDNDELGFPYVAMDNNNGYVSTSENNPIFTIGIDITNMSDGGL